MAKINGSVIIPILDGDAVIHTTSSSISIDVDLPDATTKDSGGWADHIHGLKSFSLTIEGYAAYDAAGNVKPLIELITDRESATFEFAPDTAGDVKLSGSVSLSNLELGAGLEETATLSCTLTGKGAITVSTVS